MNEIKFRAVIETPEGDKKMVNDYAFVSQDNLHMYGNGNIADPYYTKRVIAVMQYIGSHDTNGKEIYEGDILEALSGNTFCIIYDNDEMRFCIRDVGGMLYNINCKLYKIVGNIYENLELLK